MISLKALLLEKMTFRELLKYTDADRRGKARTMDVKSSSKMDVKSLNVKYTTNSERMEFSYKSSPSVTGVRHRGAITFLKRDLNANKGRSLEDIPCIVDCSCPDFKYTFAYGDKQQGACVIGSGTLNQNNGAKPKDPDDEDGAGRGINIGLCKHLVSLGRYLKTRIDSKRTLKENINVCGILNEIGQECDNKLIIINEGVIIDWAKKRLIELEDEIKALELKWDDMDSKSLNTYEIQKKLENRKKELDNIKTVLDLQK